MENAKSTAMFNGIARRYDLLNHLLSFGVDCLWRWRLVRSVARGGAVGRILDVATGTGDIAIALARHIPAAKVVGVDLSEGMLDIGRVKVAHKGLDIELKVDNGEALSFESSSFDVVTIGFGIRNFEDRQRGLREFSRVLCSGGTVYILELSSPGRGIFSRLYRLYSRRILPVVGGWISGDRGSYRYLPASVEGFPAAADFLVLMRGAGFTECSARRLTGGIAYIYSGKKP